MRHSWGSRRPGLRWRPALRWHPGLRWGGLSLMLGLAVTLTGCVDGDDSGPSGTGGAEDSERSTVSVTMGQPHEFGLELSATDAPAGDVTFEVTNQGALPHQFAIVQHEGDPGALPMADGNVDLDALDILGDSGGLDPGATASVNVELEAGSYVIFSSTGGHYNAGMFTGFTVE